MIQNNAGQIILVSSASTDWADSKRVQGQLDIPLNNKGKEQIAKIAQVLSGIAMDAVFSSPLQRALSVASAIVEKRNLKVKIIKEFIDLDQGIWQGLLLSEIKKRYEKQYVTWQENPVNAVFPKGESLFEAHKRVSFVLPKILAKARNKNICIVSHRTIVALIKIHILKLELNSIKECMLQSGSYEILKYNNG